MSPKTDRIVVDAIHGAIELSELERRVIDTASFQRLRHLKQLGLGHVTYPNATHTRFAHSLGVLAIMKRLLNSAADALNLDKEEKEDLRLAALLHDVGHYPYSHLMERLDRVQLTEDRIRDGQKGKGTIDLKAERPYPDHEEVGRLVVTKREDMIQAIGGRKRAAQIADLFTRGKATDLQRSKLLHSSLDMDRLDYLIRDARAAGVPYGEVDINYLLNNLHVSPTGMVGIDFKALPAAEHFLLARSYMHRTVYYHKTTFDMEEAFRQLLRRCRDGALYDDVPSDGEAIRRLVVDPLQWLEFTDHLPDSVARRALGSGDPVIKRLAEAIAYRRPPKLLREEFALIDVNDESEMKHNSCTSFLRTCERELGELAGRYELEVGRFLIAEPPLIRLESRGVLIPAAQAGEQPPEEEDELIKVFGPEDEEPRSLVDIPQSLIQHVAHYVMRIARVYIVETDERKVERLKTEVSHWD
jgi:HD superfamily phosphohydrolase